MMPRLVVGLTGGIGSGKTAVSDLFSALGVTIVDTDIIARTLVEPGQVALAEIIQRFGPTSCDSTGRLDRSFLRQLIFSDQQAKHDLESILHPRIDHEVRSQLAAAESNYAIVVIPLLAETGGQRDYLDRIAVVDVPESVQISRVIARDAIDQRQAEAALTAQASRDARLQLADDIIRNDKDVAHLSRQVRQLHERYLHMASSGVRDNDA